MVSTIQRRLGFRTDGRTEQAIVDNLGVAQERLETEEFKTLPWFLLSEVANTRCTPNDERVEVPTGFLGETEKDGFWITDTNGGLNLLTKGPYDYLKTEYTGTGQPVAYSLVGEYYRLHPTPDTNYLARIFFYKKATTPPTVLSGNLTFESKWMEHAPTTILTLTGMLAAKDLQNDRQSQMYEQEFTAAKADLFVKIVNRDLANMTYTPEDIV